jgi:hypothetical protein
MSPLTGTLLRSFECFRTPPNSPSVIPAVEKTGISINTQFQTSISDTCTEKK